MSRSKVNVKYRKIQSADLEYDHKSLERGTYGDVRKATWQGKIVAVKMFSCAEKNGAFSEELVSLSMLHEHDNIVTLHGAHLGNTINDRPFLVLEFAPHSLERVLHHSRQELKYTIDNVMSWTFQMASALEFIHNQDILHRDVKPSNTLLFQDGRVLKLCDFGTAREQQHTLTNAVGTYWYMAPEVIRGTHYTHSCDVYSFGVVLWEMITRHKPYLAGTFGKSVSPQSVLYRVATGGRPPMISKLPKCLEELIERCWDEASHIRPTMLEIKSKMKKLMKLIGVEERKPFIHRRASPNVNNLHITEVYQGPQNIHIIWQNKHPETISKFIVQGYGKQSKKWTDIEETDDTAKNDITFAVDSNRQYTSVRVGAIYGDGTLFGSEYPLRTFVNEDEVNPVICIHEIKGTAVTVYTKRPAFAENESNTIILECKERENDDFYRVNGQESDRMEYHQKFLLELKSDATPVLRATYEYSNGDCAYMYIEEELESTKNVTILNSILNDMPTFKLKMANVVFVGPPRGGKSSLLCSIVGLAPPEASTAVVEYACATMYEGCIRTILATLEGNSKLKTLTAQETKERADLSIFLNYVHAAQMQKNKQGITEKNDEIHRNVNGSHDEISTYEQGDASNPENSVDTHETLGHEGTDIEETGEVTEQHHPKGKHSENMNIEEKSISKYDIDVFDLKQSLTTLIEEGVMNRIFANQEKLLVHLFDTGGQPELLELLPHVLSARNSIFVICFKESEPLNERYLVKYVSEDKSKHCLTTISQLTTEETIFQCIYSAKFLPHSMFSMVKNTIFVSTHVDQAKDSARNHKKKIEDYMVGLGLLPRDTASDLMSQRYFSVCTERELQLLLASLHSEDKKEVLINDLFTKEHEEWIGKMDGSLTKVIVREESIKYVGDNDGRKVELQPLLDILKHRRDEKVKDLLEYTGVPEVKNVLCKMIHKTEESVDISLRAYLLYLALVHKPDHKENDANIEPIVTLLECIQLAEALHCMPPYITTFKEKIKVVQEYLEMLESKLHLVKCSFSSEGEVDASALIICDPNALYKKISEMVCQCYLDPRNKNKLRRRGLVDEDMVLKCTFQRTVEGIRMAQEHLKDGSQHDGSQHDGAEEILLKFLLNQRIISYKNDGLIRVPSALRAYPTEIIPMSKNVIVPSLILVPKGKCLPLGVITTLMTCGEEWKYGNDNIMVIWTLFPEELFRNRVKYHVNGSMYVTLVSRPTCIEIRVEEQEANEFKCDDTSIFRKACESLKNKLEEIVHVEFKRSLVCQDHITASTVYQGNDGFRCKHSVPHSGYSKNCSVWYEEVSSAEELTNILYSPVCSNQSGINNDARPDGETLKLYFAEGDDTKSNNEETKAHFRKIKWFKIGLVLLKGQTYDALEDHFERLFLEDPYTDFNSEVIKMWLKTEDASWDSLYRNIEFAYPDIAKKIKDERGRCQNEVEGDPNELQKSSFEEKADEYALRECQSVIISTIAKDLTHFSNLLAQHTFIRSDLGMEIQTKYGITESQKASELFLHVTNKFHRTLLAEKEKLFEEFLRIFTAEAAYHDVAKHMMEKYVKRDPAYKGPMRILIEDVRDDDGTAFHLLHPHNEVETGCENPPTSTPPVRIPEKDISHVYLGGYLQPVVVLIIGVLLGLVWWVYNSYF